MGHQSLRARIVNRTWQPRVAEALGTALLTVAVVGSGIMGERLSGGNAAIALLANAIATGGALVALIAALGPISGAHFNPAVTLAEAQRGSIPWAGVPAYLVAQFAGGLLGVALAHFIFQLPMYAASQHVRTGPSQWVSEFVGTFGLLLTIFSCSRWRPGLVPVAVGAYITAGYWFLSSTCLANPALTLARSLTDTFAGIRPVDVPGFILAQLAAVAITPRIFAWIGRGAPGKPQESA
jgi:glycerol uptake facilitator-like aquaporin